MDRSAGTTKPEFLRDEARGYFSTLIESNRKIRSMAQEISDRLFGHGPEPEKESAKQGVAPPPPFGMAPLIADFAAESGKIQSDTAEILSGILGKL